MKHLFFIFMLVLTQSILSQKSKGHKNVFWDGSETLNCLYSDEPIEPNSKGGYHFFTLQMRTVGFMKKRYRDLKGFYSTSLRQKNMHKIGVMVFLLNLNEIKYLKTQLNLRVIRRKVKDTKTFFGTDQRHSTVFTQMNLLNQIRKEDTTFFTLQMRTVGFMKKRYRDLKGFYSTNLRQKNMHKIGVMVFLLNLNETKHLKTQLNLRVIRS